MFVMTKQAVLFRRPDGETFYAPNGYMGQVPEWVTKTKQFQRQVNAGKIVASQTAKDKDMEAAQQAAQEKKELAKSKGKKGKAAEDEEKTNTSADEEPSSGEDKANEE